MEPLKLCMALSFLDGASVAPLEPPLGLSKQSGNAGSSFSVVLHGHQLDCWTPYIPKPAKQIRHVVLDHGSCSRFHSQHNTEQKRSLPARRVCSAEVLDQPNVRRNILYVASFGCLEVSRR
jgi:hypothetical protein